MSPPDPSGPPGTELTMVDLPVPPLEARVQFARFLVEQLSRHALVELGILADEDPGPPK